MLRQSAAEWTFMRDGMDPARTYERLAAIGYDAVEIAPPEHWELARAAGLELLNLAAPGMDWGLNDREEHARILPAVRETIAAASGAGIPHVIVFSGNRRGRSDEEGVESCVRGLDALAAEAADASVTLLFELLNGVDHPDYHAASTAFMAEVVERVDAPSVRALYDVYHAARMGEDVVADVARHAPLIGHLHVAGAPGRGFPGPEQEIDYAAVIAAAEAAGYDGRVGHEFLCGPDPLDELERAHRLFATFA